MTPQATSAVMRGMIVRLYDFKSVLNLAFLTHRRHVSYVRLKSGERLLDVGCGTGAILSRLWKTYGKEVELYGADPSEDMIRIARRKFPESIVQFVAGMGEKLPFESNYFDWVISSLAFHHMPCEVKEATLKEAWRLLKPGGNILVTDFGKPVNLLGELIALRIRKHHFTSENIGNILFNLMRKVGFRQVDILSVQHGIVYHIRGKKP